MGATTPGVQQLGFCAGDFGFPLTLNPQVASSSSAISSLTGSTCNLTMTHFASGKKIGPLPFAVDVGGLTCTRTILAGDFPAGLGGIWNIQLSVVLAGLNVRDWSAQIEIGDDL